MIEISKEDYRRIAANLKEAIGTAEWFNGRVTLPPPAAAPPPPVAKPSGYLHAPPAPPTRAEADATETDGAARVKNTAESAAGVENTADSADDWRLVLTAIIYRRDELLPEGPRRPISDVVPVWWEFSTGEIPNNFSFAELRPCLIDYE
jgi:hypothetical protein